MNINIFFFFFFTLVLIIIYSNVKNWHMYGNRVKEYWPEQKTITNVQYVKKRVVKYDH